MKIPWLIILVFTIFCNDQLVLGLRRISEIKCQEYAQIVQNSSIVNMNRVLIKHSTSNPAKWSLIGTLISEKFILSAYRSDYNLSGVKAYDVHGDGYMEIDAYFRRPIFNGTEYSFGIVLLQLRNPLQLNSFHRPACLWTTAQFDSSWAELLLRRVAINEPLKSKPIKIVNSSVCRNSNLFCVQSSQTNNRYTSLIGSPILVNRSVKNKLTNNFVLGLALDHSVNSSDQNNIFAVKIFNHLDWIEANVWKFEDICGRQQIDMVPVKNYPQTAKYGEFPWQAALIEISNNVRTYICSGTILNDAIVLTAAHCVTDVSVEKSMQSLVVGLGCSRLSRCTVDSKNRKISKIIVHPRYLHQYLKNDIALLKLQNRVSFSRWIQPICLASNHHSFDGEVGYLPGWSSNGRNETSIQLKKCLLEIRTVPDHGDNNRPVFSIYSNENNFHATYKNGSACTDDSGGGLVFKIKFQWYIQGIGSLRITDGDHSASQCNPLQTTLFTNVTRYYDWIWDNL